MSGESIIIGLLLLWTGYNIGILVAKSQLDRAIELLNEAKKWHKKIENDLQRFQEQTPK